MEEQIPNQALDEAQAPQGTQEPAEVAQEPTQQELDEKELMALQQELQQSEASIEQDFASFAASNLSADDEELFFEDKEAFIKKILEMQNVFLKENFEPKINRANELMGKITQERSFGEIDAAKDEFMANHPEADINALMEFYTQNPQVAEGLQNASPLEFFEGLYAQYLQAQGAQEPQAQDSSGGGELPQRISGVPMRANEAGVSGADSVVNRF